jgi:UDP-N-acetylmuramate--alanine ligase
MTELNLKHIRQAYFIGIGGIGMSAIARYFNMLGIKVSGYDKTETLLTKELSHEGIFVHYDDSIEAIPSAIKEHADQEDTIIIFTPAIPKDHLGLNYFRDRSIRLYKRAEILGIITRGTQNIAVAGTHGKTTTSSLVAHLLRVGDVDCSAFLGGITANYNSNFLLGGPEACTVVEADEFDRSFLHLNPDYSVITSMDADHLDIYGSDEVIKSAFNEFAARLKPGGLLIYKAGLPLQDLENIHNRTYSTSEDAFYRSTNLDLENGTFRFDLLIGGKEYEEFKSLELGVPGRHNMENALAASAIALEMGVSAEKLREGLRSFRGVKRRFEYIIKSDKLVFIDDYAHHPAELEACITAVKQIYPDKKLTGIFQPHLYTRTRDFADGFAKSLSLLDELILLDIYPARELPVIGVSSEMILEKVTCKKELCSKEELPERMKKYRPEVLLTLGAGDIDTLVEPLKNYYLNEAEGK